MDEARPKQGVSFRPLNAIPYVHLQKDLVFRDKKNLIKTIINIQLRLYERNKKTSIHLFKVSTFL